LRSFRLWAIGVKAHRSLLSDSFAFAPIRRASNFRERQTPTASGALPRVDLKTKPRRKDPMFRRFSAWIFPGAVFLTISY
jgi:hypothetical protein